MILASLLLSRCGNEGDWIESKNECLDEKLDVLKTRSIYKVVKDAFADTFKIMSVNYPSFNYKLQQNSIDDAVFFKRDSTECVLIVMQKMENTPLFGYARIVQGENKKGTWRFKISTEFSFDASYYQLYKKNSQENLSKLARYSVLTSGETKGGGCELDEEYWFVMMKR